MKQLVDCTLAYHFDIRPRLSLEDAQAPLPSHESLWQAEAEDSWQELYRKSSGKSLVYAFYSILLTAG